MHEKALNTENVRMPLKIQTFNKIAKRGLDLFSSERYTVGEAIESPDAIVLRSQKLHDWPIPESLNAIGRAGAGVNNIPVDKCTEKGVVVFNSPGANANAVKELVIAGMLLAARDISGGIEFSKTLLGKNDEVGPSVEKNKSTFAGSEIAGKTLGVVGLGAIGLMVANMGVKLGMNVIGHDPFLSVGRAWELSSDVKPASSLEKLLSDSDYITIHVPYSAATKEFFSEDRISNIKQDAVLLNFSRDALVNESAIIAALKNGAVAKYVTDFPTQNLLETKGVIPIPHLGASTLEAEENCAVMIANQLTDFLENGNITNSVNFPNCVLERSGNVRLTIINKNVPNMIGSVTSTLADEKLNIIEMVNKSSGDYAYNIVDISGTPSEDLIDKINAIDGVIRSKLL